MHDLAGHAGATPPTARPGPSFLAREELATLIDLLRADGRTVIGPTVADGAIVLAQIAASDDLPRGWGDRQEAGRYRLEQRGDDRLFAFNMGPTSFKRYTFPPRSEIGRSRTTEGGGATFETAVPEPARLAFLGVRACEIEALRIQDRVLTEGPYVDADYAARRASALVIAVNCTTAASTCFCTSMGSGPEVRSGHDLALTELEHGFLVEAGSVAGAALLRGFRSAR